MQAVSPLMPDVAWPPLKPYWESLARHQLSFPKCAKCGRFQWYPRATCTHCMGREFAWTPVTPKGHVYSYSIVRRRWLADARVPYAVLQVSIDDAPGVTLLCNLVEEGQAPQLAVGVPVSLEFQEVSGKSETPLTMAFARIG